MKFSVSISEQRIPYNQMPMTAILKSLDRKIYRDQYCWECGHPFVAISDKVIAIIDNNIPIEMLRENEKVIEARCRYHYCRQFYRLYV